MSLIQQKKSPQKFVQFVKNEDFSNQHDQKTQDQNNSLLLTPNTIDLQIEESNKPKAIDKREEPTTIFNQNIEIQEKRKAILLKRQQFIKRVLQQPANNKEIQAQIENKMISSENEYNNNLLAKQDQTKKIETKFEKMDIQEVKQSGQERSSAEIGKQQSSFSIHQNNLNKSTDLKSISEQNQNYHSNNQTKLKFQHQSNIDDQRKSNQDNQTKQSFTKQMNTARRVTLGPDSFLKKLGIEKNRKSLGTNQQGNTGIGSNSPRESLVTQAFRRLSGGSSNLQKFKRKSRVTLDFRQFSRLLTVSDLDQNNNILQIFKKQAVNPAINEREEKQKQMYKSRRQFLEEYVQSSNNRYRIARQNIQAISLKNQQLIKNIERIDQLQKEFNDLLQSKQHKIAETTSKFEKKAKTIKSTDEMLALMQPIFYLEQSFGIKIISVQQSNKSLSFSKDYLIDFVIDGNVYCKIKSKQGQEPSITVKPSTILQNNKSKQTMDSEMRKSLLQIYFSQKLIKEQPIKILIKLGEYYKQIQKIERDLQMIHCIFDIQELNLNAKKQLYFKIRIDYSLIIEVTINLLEYLQMGHYSIKSISNRQQLRHESQGKEPFLQFLSNVLERANQ